MKMSATMSWTGDAWLAQCEEVDCAGEGASAQEALAQLHEALEDYFDHAEAVGPPSEAPHEDIEIVIVGTASSA
ncbi:MAG TPA: hypothetical protein VIY73_15780 [Polyangiaceae bacterium]